MPSTSTRATRVTARSLAMILALLALVVLPTGATGAHSPTAPPDLWGYAAAAGNAPIGNYDIAADTFDGSCVPNPTNNGRGIALDPLDGNLWYTFVDSAFNGDGLIHKTDTSCNSVGSIPFRDGPGGVVQDDVGAIDVDPVDANLWVAGYKPVGGQSLLYKLDRSTGAVLQFCSVPFAGGGEGNDTLAVAELDGLAGSGRYLLTDAGEVLTSLLVIDTVSCAGGGPVAPVTTYTLPLGVTGIDYEGGELIATNLTSIFDLGAPPFGVVGATMGTSGLALEDITLTAELQVDIDIKPGSFPNSINVTSKGVIPVAILGSALLDVTQIDYDTVCFAGDCTEAHETVHLEDVNGDGYLDAVLHFETQETNIAAGDTEACLTGNLSNGTPFQGCDSVRTVPPA